MIGNVRWLELLVETVHQAYLSGSKSKDIPDGCRASAIISDRFVKSFGKYESAANSGIE